MESMSKERLRGIAETNNNTIIVDAAIEALAEEFKGDEVAQKMIKLSQLLTVQKSGADIDEDEIRRIIRDEIETEKISLDNLDSTVRNLLQAQPTTITVNVKTAGVIKVTSVKLDDKITRPTIQALLSDVLARNNSFLYGGAGTGKTFSAKTVAEVLDWELIVVNCNQFTSALELIGGQTIDGYQEGKVIRAYGNFNADGTKMSKSGCVLLLDELPKIDPNTAGILNNALASVGEFSSSGKPSTIQNAKGDVIERGNCFIMATGNSKLNEADADYEANFKQDLSLQDRFVGSTYKVVVDEFFEWNGILEKRWAFIFLYLTKLRKLIEEKKFTGKAFVSIRLMQSVQKTYNVFREKKQATGKTQQFTINKMVSFTPIDNQNAFQNVTKDGIKTVKNTMDEFFSLFTDIQSNQLKKESDYNGWLSIVQQKNKMPMDKLNTDEELEEVNNVINK